MGLVVNGMNLFTQKFKSFLNSLSKEVELGHLSANTGSLHFAAIKKSKTFGLKLFEAHGI